MQETRNVFNEVIEMFSNQETLQRDMQEAFALMQEHLHNKYMKKMAGAVVGFQKQAHSNPSPQVRLLQSCKPFVSAGSHESIDSFIDMMQSVSMMQELSVNLQGVSAPSEGTVRASAVDERVKDSSLHQDGVYDIDNNCQIGGAGGGGQGNALMLLFAMMAQKNS